MCPKLLKHLRHIQKNDGFWKYEYGKKSTKEIPLFKQWNSNTITNIMNYISCILGVIIYFVLHVEVSSTGAWEHTLELSHSVQLNAGGWSKKTGFSVTLWASPQSTKHELFKWQDKICSNLYREGKDWSCAFVTITFPTVTFQSFSCLPALKLNYCPCSV